jgi:hypothetical protein
MCLITASSRDFLVNHILKSSNKMAEPNVTGLVIAAAKSRQEQAYELYCRSTMRLIEGRAT